jgi:hypothetical protein
MKSILLLLSFIIVVMQGIAGNVSGRVTDNNHKPLAFTSILIKGTTKGTSANSAGEYSITLTEGEYTIIAQHVGYKSFEAKVVVSKESVHLDFELQEQKYELANVTVHQGEDPAYEIIRNAIKKRPYYEKEIKKFETEVYIKGQLQLRDYPKRFFGKPVDFEDGDTSKHKMMFLSETVAKYSVDEPHRKVEVLSTKVSGQSDAFGFSSPQIISFYQNNIRLGNVNPRGFISPISNNALNYYRYHFEGTFFENGQMVNRIRVIPKRKYEPLFNGYINIIENEWRIQSVQLSLYKQNQLQLADTIKIEQLYVPLGNVWIIKQQTIYPSVKILGFDVYGSFVQVYDKYTLNPVFEKKHFDNTVLKIYDSANKKPSAYWDSIRPLPLLQEEVNDYKKKDSLEEVRKSPRYMDSLDRKSNKINFSEILTTGKTFTNRKNKSSISIEGLVQIVNYNTVEGLVLDVRPTYRKRFSDTKPNALTVTPGLRYGFSNKRFNPNLTVGYRLTTKNLTSFSVAGGRDVFQYNNANPVRVFWNTLRTLRDERNYLKIYEAGFGRLNVVRAIGEGVTVSAHFEYQDRLSLNNTTSYKWRDYPDRDFTPNITMPNNKASIASLNIRWQPGARYIEMPERTINVGSKFPTLNLTLTKGIKGFLGSDVDYAKWQAAVNDNLNLKLAGRFNYRVTAGGFLERKSVFFPDYTHFFGNLGTVAAPYLTSFQLLPYYSNYSNVEKFYSTAHAEYHLNGFLTNKIPVFKKLNWFLVTGTNFLYLQNHENYAEVFVGLENIFKVGRIDFVKSFTKENWNTTGIRYSLSGMIR